MKLVDTHTHVQFRGFEGEKDEVMQRALAAGVTVINVGTQTDTSNEAVLMLSKYPEHVYAIVGLHPIHTYSHHVDEEESSFITREETFNYDTYKQLADNPRVVGIGECGLDYYRLPEDKSEAMIAGIKHGQREVFKQQIKLAIELNKVLCVHCRPSVGTMDAYDELYEILKAIPEIQSGQLKFEVHCYTGNLAGAQKFISLGGYIGINGILTFDKTGVASEVVQNIPLDRILLETDAPYLTPVPYRGQRNQPSYVLHVAEKVAEVRGISVEEVATQTTQNAVELFKLIV